MAVRSGNIILIRHGPPDVVRQRLPDSFDFAEWAERYDRAPLELDLSPPPSTIEAAGAATTVFTSMLPRSRQSADALGLAGGAAMSIFDEPGLPVPALPVIRLPIEGWLLMCRSLWLMGLHAESETYRATLTRASAGADILATAALTGNVVLIGHGWINRFIGSTLRRQGWVRCAGSSAPWGVTIYTPSDCALGRVNGRSAQTNQNSEL